VIRAAALVLLAVAIAGCESTQDKAARIRAEGDQALAGRHGLRITSRNKDVDVLTKQIVADANGVAVVVGLENRGKADQANVPIAIELDDAKGKKVFANDAPGLEPALTSVALLPPGKPSYWVHNQIVAAGTPKKLSVVVGEAGRAKVPAEPPHITISDVELQRDSSGAFLEATANNRSGVMQKRLTIFCVALKGGEVVAAGRAVVDKLAPAEDVKKPVRFALYFIGDPRGAQLDFTVPPVALS
jgi:hypothetical protein